MIYFWSNREELSCSLNLFYDSIGQTKQSFHQMLNRRLKMSEEVSYLIPIINQIRRDHPTMSCRAMYYKINPFSIGRDRFESICKDLGLNSYSPRGKKRTTDSTGVVRFENLLEHTELTNIDQAYSSDITYYEIGNCFYYITFILDCYSRRILGHSVSGRLTAEQTTIPALKMAIRTRKNTILKDTIFHSDGGGQYYDKEFLKLTERYKFKNSMCEYAYENGKAERVNGIIKNCYLKYWPITSLEELFKSVDRAVDLYNMDKPHKSLKYKTPLDFEKACLSLTQTTTPRVKESFDAKIELMGVKPFNSRISKTT